MTDTEPWNDDGTEPNDGILSVFAAACVLLAIIWTPITVVLSGLALALGVGGLFLTAAIMFSVGSNVAEARS